uniref:Uncharacterized protein n=1 Tax=Rhizophora mucronata TaxID=61149 RepID=A0A2P2NU93_RHIMU
MKVNTRTTLQKDKALITTVVPVPPSVYWKITNFSLCYLKLHHHLHSSSQYAKPNP